MSPFFYFHRFLFPQYSHSILIFGLSTAIPNAEGLPEGVPKAFGAQEEVQVKVKVKVEVKVKVKVKIKYKRFCRARRTFTNYNRIPMA